MSVDGRGSFSAGKILILAIFLLKGVASAGTPIRVLLDSPPLTLNPRFTLDASGQKLNALLFRGLTTIDADLNAKPDLAESWHSEDSGKKWIFRIKKSLKDNAGSPITAEKLASCLEEYRQGKPASPIKAGFPFWRGTKGRDDLLVVELDKPDPYLPRNVTLLRYFVKKGDSEPCREPGDEPVTGSGRYHEAGTPLIGLSPESDLHLVSTQVLQSDLDFHFVRDDNSRLLSLLRGDSDVVAPNCLSLAKMRWIQMKHDADFNVIERAGVNVSYMAFNLKDPILSRKDVRLAIALAIDRVDIVKNKLFGIGTIAGSLLSPILPESTQAVFDYNPKRSRELLDQAGLKPGPDGIRFHLKYKTTPVREGLETAIIFQAMLRKIGVELSLDVVEPAVFLASIRKGAFQIYSSRWVGIADGSILYRTLRSGQNNNRVGYENTEMNEWLDRAMSEMDLAKRTAILKKVQMKMAEDLPYFPLWYWGNTVITKKSFTGLGSTDLSLSGGLIPLGSLHDMR